MILNQFLFLISVYVVGLTFSIFHFKELGHIVRGCINPFLGIIILSISVGFLIIYNFPINLISVFLVIFILWFVLNIKNVMQNFRSNEKIYLLGSKSYLISKELITLFILYTVIGTFFILLKTSIAGSDSTQFEGVGRFFANGGKVIDKPPFLAFLLNGRLLVIGAMHALNRLFGSYNLYALNPTIVIWFLCFITLLFYDFLCDLQKLPKIILSGMFFLSLVFSKNFFLQIFYIHSNGFAMIYYSLAIISLYAFTKSGKNSWLRLGSFFIGAATLIRIDMLIFSLLYFVLLTKLVKDDASELKRSWTIFFLVSFPWRLFTLSYTSFDVFYVNATHILLLLFAHILLASFTIIYQKRIGNIYTNLPLLCMVSLLIFISLYSIFHPESLQLTWEIFVKYRLLGQDWIFLFITMVLMLSITPIMNKKDPDLKIISYSIWIYILLLFLMVTIYGYSENDHSAGRILNQLVSLSIFWVYISFSRVLGYQNKPI